MAAKDRYEQAVGLEERIRTLREYLSLIPKHKGTEKLRLTLRGRLSKLEAEKEDQRKRQRTVLSSAKSPWNVEKQGAGLVVLVGVTNSGKSQLLHSLTGAKVEIADYQFTTKLPMPGALYAEDVLLTLIELPAIVEGSAFGRSQGRRIFGIIRNARLVILIINLNEQVEDQMTLLLKEFEESNVRLNQGIPPVKIQRTGSGGIQIYGANHYEGTTDELLSFLRGLGFTNALIDIRGPITLQDIEEASNPRIQYKKAIVAATKGDLSGSASRFSTLKKGWETRFPIIAVSAVKNIGLEDLKKAILNGLDIIRVYTKEPGKEATEDPLILEKGATIRDAAQTIHKTFIDNFRYARVFGSSVKHPGTKVGLNHVLADKDIIEIRT